MLNRSARLPFYCDFLIYISLVLFLIALPTVSIRAADENRRFYETLADSVQSASGQANVNLTKGYWRTELGDTQMLWNVSNNTRLKIKFNYAGGGLQSGEVTFTPLIHVVMKTDDGGCISLGIRKITYDEGGRIDIPDWSFDTSGSCKATTAVPALERHLEMSTRPSEMFLGLPFKSSSSTIKCTNSSGTNCTLATPMATRIQLFPSLDANGNVLPALRVRFKDQATLKLPGDDLYAFQLESVQ